ncbi:hypothetical protein JK231_12270 [Pantoea sp. JGM49]|uniref:hypothetical protein n=1 Tax=unclassified Pantoea TaxID=2630326 RepID=UPI001929264D|nr:MULTISPECIES: hypothetical protein [unclassified Pantoea]MBS0881376.1 hypothetical protein [Pantoea sp. JGM49]MDI9278687.1 hypothetical protein [Pantoea sp. EABMAA-21]
MKSNPVNIFFICYEPAVFHSTHFCRTTKKRAEHAVQPVSCGDMFRKKDHCAKGKFSAINGFSLTLQ